MDAVTAEKRLFLKVGGIIRNKLIKEFKAQGHSLTGAWEQSVHDMVLSRGNVTQLLGTMALYGVYVDSGVGPNKIAFNEGSGAGHSKYIDGLQAFWMKRGKSEKEAKSLAFATAKVHKKEGMPSAGSYKYSSTGSRTNFVKTVEKAIDGKVDEMISKGLDDIVDRKFRQTKSETI